MQNGQVITVELIKKILALAARFEIEPFSRWGDLNYATTQSKENPSQLFIAQTNNSRGEDLFPFILLLHLIPIIDTNGCSA